MENQENKPMLDEEHPDFNIYLKDALKRAGEAAVQNAKEKGRSWSYRNEKNELVREYPDGRIELISTEL